MLDIMELRGFSMLRDKGGRQLILVTPNDNGYAVQLFPHISPIKCAFIAFEAINHLYP